jgi:PAS domain-containing protein
MVSFAMSVGYSRRFARRIEEPIGEIHDALRDFSQGQRFRRSVVVDAPLELIEIADRLQDVFDRAGGTVAAHDDVFARADRAALLHLLDASHDVRVVADGTGLILAANRTAQDRFGAPDGTILRSCLIKVARGEVESPRWDMTELGDGVKLIAEHRSTTETRAHPQEDA